MRRREFIMVLSSAVATAPFVARAEQPERIGRIGVLMLYPESDPQGQLRATVFRREFEKLGWTVGGNLQIKVHWGTGDADWVRSAAAEVLGPAARGRDRRLSKAAAGEFLDLIIVIRAL
jgi:putative ABC transport system substrate-binding protein